MSLRIGPRAVYVRPSPLHGLGVFAGTAHRTGDVLEVSPVLVVPPAELPALRRTALYPYYFQWPPGQGALALGFGSLYNHAYQPNARFDLDVAGDVIVFTAVRPIRRNDEITINYNGEPADLEPLWFRVRPAAG